MKTIWHIDAKRETSKKDHDDAMVRSSLYTRNLSGVAARSEGLDDAGAPKPHDTHEGVRREMFRQMNGKVTGNTAGLRPAVREELERLSRLGVKPGQMWDESIVHRMAYLSYQLDRVLAIFLGEGGEIREVRLGGREDVDLTGSPTRRCIRTAFGEIKSLPHNERMMLLEAEMESIVCVGVGMALAHGICMGWRSLAGTGGVILYGPIRPRRVS